MVVCGVAAASLGRCPETDFRLHSPLEAQGQGEKLPAGGPGRRRKTAECRGCEKPATPVPGALLTGAVSSRFLSGGSQSLKALPASLPSSASSVSVMAQEPGLMPFGGHLPHLIMGSSSSPFNYTLLTPTPARHGRAQSTATGCHRLRCSWRGWHQPWAPASESWGHCLEGGQALIPDPESREARPAAQGSNTSLKLDAAPLSSHHGPPTAVDHSRPSRSGSDRVNDLLTNFFKTRMASRVPHAKAPHTHFSPNLGAGGRGRVEDSSSAGDWA